MKEREGQGEKEEPSILRRNGSEKEGREGKKVKLREGKQGKIPSVSMREVRGSEGKASLGSEIS